MLGVSHIGNHGTRLPHNPATLGVDANMNDPSVLALGATVLQSNINSAAAQAAGIRLPYPGFTGNVAQALRKYPQYQNISWRGVPVGESKYHALETVLERRFSRGLQARVAYTFSKLHNNASENAQGSDGLAQRFKIPRTRSVVPQCGRYAARVPSRLRGSAKLLELVVRCRKALLADWNVGVLRYERAAVQYHDGQRSCGFLFNNQKRRIGSAVSRR